MIDSTQSPTRKPRRKNEADIIPEVNTYEFRCQCGCKITGVRPARPSITDCLQCQRQHYLLPECPYPEPKKIKAKKKRRRGPPARQILGAMQSKVTGLGTSFLNTLTLAAQRLKLSFFNTLSWTRRQFTPLRMLSASIAMVVLLTAWYGIHTRAVSLAQIQFNDSWTKAQQDLANDDLEAASQQLELSVKALNVLRPGDDLEQQVRQLGRETTTLTHLSSRDLFEIAEDAQAYADDRKIDLWSTRFRTIYHGSWMIFETRIRINVSSSSDTASRPPKQIEYAPDLWYRQSPLILQGDLPAFDHLDLSGEWLPVVIAARLINWERTSTQPAGWLISLDEKESFLWCHQETLNYLGDFSHPWETSPDRQQLFERQCQAAHVLPATSVLNGLKQEPAP